MRTPHLLTLLCLEDDLRDRELLEATLKAHGLACRIAYAQAEDQFRSFLGRRQFDLIVSDFTLPTYNGLAALELARTLQPETPFIFVSGTIGEERAVESLRAGATDYVLKDNLERLAPVIQRAVRQAREKRRRKHLEDTTTESEARLRQIVENAAQAFWLVDLRTNKLLYVSPGYEKIWRRSRETLYRKPGQWMEAIYPNDRDQVVQAALARQAQGDYDETYRIVRPDGSIRWIRDRAYPLRDEFGELYRMVGVAEDITERRQLEERNHEARQLEATARLARGVAREFNNLLTVMRGNAELVLMQAGDRLDGPQRGCLGQVMAATERAAHLCDQLLAFGRPQTTPLQPVNLNRLIEALASKPERLAGSHCSLRVRCGAASGLVRGDVGLLQRVVLNLAANARDAMPEGGELALSTEQVHFDETHAAISTEVEAGDSVCLAVSDTGCGISPEHRAHLFEPFFTTKPPGQVSGLGLATVYGIVKQHRGWIEVASQLGKGTTFRIFLPALPSPSRMAA